MSEPTRTPRSLWLLDAAPEFPALDGEVDAEVLVVGGGITGVTLAYTLAEQDSTVVMLEAGEIAGGASGRNAGFLLAAPAEPYQEAIAMWGREGARAILHTGRRTHERIRDLAETLAIDCDHRVAGSVRLARTEEEAEDHRASLAHLRLDGFPMQEVPVGEVVPTAAAGTFAAAFLTHGDGEIHPVRFLRGLARAAAARGARLFENAALMGARWRGGLWEARTAAGVVRTRHLVLATNAWAPALCPALESIIVPRRGQMLSTAPLAEEVTSRPVLAHWGYQYWRQTPDGRLVIGGWREIDRDGEVGYGIEPGARIQDAIEAGLHDLVPGGVAIEHRWAGTMGFARDGRPLVGWLDADHHLAICAGFTGHGMGMAAACTLDLANLLSFRAAPGIATYDPSRFPELRPLREGLVALGETS
jgi:glycine/D-amino acid oxidase-like deaminating enzyme